MRLLIAVVIHLFLVVPCAYSANYYVSTTGNDSNPGTEESPWLTISKCASTISAGDTCIIKDGTYSENVTITNSGSSGNVITYQAQNKNYAVVSGVITINGNYITVDGLKQQNIQGTAVTINGNYNTLKNHYFYKPQIGIVIGGTGNVVEDNEINGVKEWNVGNDADYMRFFGSDHIIRNNYFHGTDFVNDISTAHVDCFQTFDNNNVHVYDVTVEKNICIDCHQGMMLEAKVYHLSDGLIVRNNIFRNNSSWGIANDGIKNLKVFNNVFDKETYGTAVGCRESSSCEFKNNIMYGGSASSPYWCETGSTCQDAPTGGSGRGNLLYRSGYTYTGYAEDILNVDPQFVDRSNYNYRLSAGSPGIDAGVSITNWTSPTDINGTNRPQGAGWDIGAYEYNPPQRTIKNVNAINVRFN